MHRWRPEAGAPEEYYDDYTMLRFLRARKFDIEKAKAMFGAYMEWRRNNNVDNILDVS